MPSLTKLNRSAATLTKNRTEGSVSPFSGMCVTCVDGCIGMCEIGKSAYRGAEVLYPQPFGIITAASEKEYPVALCPRGHGFHERGQAELGRIGGWGGSFRNDLDGRRERLRHGRGIGHQERQDRPVSGYGDPDRGL